MKTRHKLSLAALLLGTIAALQFGSTTVLAGTTASKQPAPEFVGIDKWLNSQPLTMQQLRGKVVLVEFWTNTCINCIHTLPYVESWYEKYKDQGLVVVGVHTPEYDYERPTESIQAAMQHFGIRYPIAQDNDYATWNAYGNRFWPATYLIDKQGRIVSTHIGEGDYEETEAAIRKQLAATN